MSRQNGSNIFWFRVSLFVALGAFAAAGWLVGWFTGASETPVVGALLPLLFGLVGGLSFGFFDRRSKQFHLQKQLEQAELTATESKKVRKALDLDLDYSAA